MRVVLFPHILLISVSKMQDEMILEGHVINGGWIYKNNGRTEQACSVYSGAIVNEWAAIQDSTIVHVPDDIKGDYNELIDWASGRPSTGNLGDLFKAYEERVAALMATDDNIPF